ncbi:MAG: tetratricopeptide repeat protein [Bacteroidales bacterium]|nr:tetratricopeptide repeat protein [Bacteroidales bacterium]
MKNKNILIALFFLCCGMFALAQTNNEQLAVQYFKNQEYEKAVGLFKRLYNNRPDAYYYNYYLETLIALQDFKEAEKLIQKQIRIYPLIQKYKVDLGQIYEQQGASSKAKKQYENCITQANLNSATVKELASAFQAYHLTDYAIKTYLQGRKNSLVQTEYAVELTHLYTQKKEYQKAIDELFVLIRDFPNEIVTVESILINWLIDDPQQVKRDIIRTNILKYSNRNPDIQVYSSLMLWFAMQEKDFTSALKQAIAIDKRYKEDGRTVYEISEIAGDNMDFKTSLNGLNYILIEKNIESPYYELSKVLSLRTKYKQITHTYPPKKEDIQTLDKKLYTYFKDNALNLSNVLLLREWVQLKSLYANDIQTAKALLEDAIYKQNIPHKEKALLKLDLGDILCLDEDVWEATLLYSQVEKDFPNDTISSTAKYKNAKLSFYLGEFDWAEAQLDVLRAATSKLIANDAMYLSLLISDNKTEDSLNLPLMYFARAKFFLENNQLQKAEDMIDTIGKMIIYHTLSDDILFLKAEIALKKQEYKKADSLFARIVDFHPHDLLADDALFMRATINEFYIKDMFTAMDLYQQIIRNYSSSIYASDARKRFRILRGDVLREVN